MEFGVRERDTAAVRGKEVDGGASGLRTGLDEKVKQLWSRQPSCWVVDNGQGVAHFRNRGVHDAIRGLRCC